MPGKVIHWSVEPEPLAPASVVTIGVFDGLHLGHQALIDQARQEARSLGVPVACVSFFPSPDSVLAGAPARYLLLPEERADLMLALGVDLVILARFDETVAALTAPAFMGRLQIALNPRQVWVGEDFALGRGRGGTPSVLADLGRELGYVLRVLPRCRVDGEVVSATLIRDLLCRGEVEKAARLLGRPYSLRGEVRHGVGRGRRLGFPTANLALPKEKLLPADGVYAGWARTGRSVYPAAINVGTNPTFEDRARSVEAFLLGFDGDLYGAEIELEMVARLRPEVKFGNIEQLQRQLTADVAAVSRILATSVSEAATCVRG